MANLGNPVESSTREIEPRPARAPTGYEHCQMVAARAAHLATLNGCSAEDTQVLRNLAYVHDIGKIAGTANPEKSVELLPRYAITEDAFVELVKYHDINLPWYLASEKGQPPSEKAWRKMAGKVDLRLLCLFMVADRADCPGGWRTNRPLAWFLDEARKRNLLTGELQLDDEPIQASGLTVEISAGAALVRQADCGRELLVIQVRAAGYELPKGHLEWEETPQQAAVRDLKEETGLLSDPVVGDLLGTLEYSFESGGVVSHKRVHYYRCTGEKLDFRDPPSRTKGVRWVREAEVEGLPLASEELRQLLSKALGRA